MCPGGMAVSSRPRTSALGRLYVVVDLNMLSLPSGKRLPKGLLPFYIERKEEDSTYILPRVSTRILLSLWQPVLRTNRPRPNRLACEPYAAIVPCAMARQPTMHSGWARA